MTLAMMTFSVTLSPITRHIMTISRATIMIMPLHIMQYRITTLGTTFLNVMLGVIIPSFATILNSVTLSAVMWNVFMVSVMSITMRAILLNVIALNGIVMGAIMLTDMAPI
jgi:hypothetical protein